MAQLETDQPQGVRIKKKGAARYVLVGLLAAFAIAGIGTYYGFASDEHLPTFHLETVEGDPAIGDAVTLEGSYVGRRGSRAMSLDAAGTRYASERDYLGNLVLPKINNNDPYYASLIAQYRSFMRGKRNGSIDQTEERLAYVIMYRKNNMGQVRLSVLDKTTGKSSNYRLDAGEWNDGFNMAVEDVQLDDSKIYVLVSRTSPQQSEFIMLTVDLGTGQQLPSRKVELPQLREGETLRIVKDRGWGSASPYVVFVASSSVHDSQGDAKSAEDADRIGKSVVNVNVGAFRSFVYRYADGAMTTFDLDREAHRYNSQFDLDGDTMYMISPDSKAPNVNSPPSYDVTAYSLSKMVRTGAYAIRASDVGAEEMLTPQFRQGRYYFMAVPKRNNGALSRKYVFVLSVEAATGRQLYKGQVVYDGSDGQAASELSLTWLNNMTIQL
ncbi:hypothetical protein [Cohnella sp. 56]|uniref:hypothetical protein n=1 Tax=Cohnella sp. 56 TaxID=3113722 RepID=UPI0030EA389E